MIEPAKTAYVFPGQGAQQVGMGRDLYHQFDSARAVFHQTDQTLGFPLSRLCFEGPEDELRQTINAQPAIVTVSLACLAAMTDTSNTIPPADLVAGHSLGEYTALAAAGVLDAADTVYLARERGRLMHQAGTSHPGGMAAIIGLDEANLTQICQLTDTRIANYNCPGQLAISGATDNLDRACEQAKARGAQRIIPLKVSGAFHTPLMQPAVDGMAQVISTLSFKPATVPIVANTTARPITDTEDIKSELLNQLCHGIHWQGSIEYMVARGVTTFIEIGPGRVLTGLIRRIDKNVSTINIGDVASINNMGGTQ